MTNVYLRTRLGSIPIHTLYNDLIANPPKGVTFSVPKKITPFYYRFDRKSDSAIKQLMLYYAKPWPYLIRERLSQNDLSDYDLIYASQHVIYLDKKWITDFEFANAFAAYGDTHLVRFELEKRLASDSCKKIMAWSDWAANTLHKSLDSGKFANKIDVVRFAVSPKPAKVGNDRKEDIIRLLFIGSNNPSNIHNFYYKGGWEMIDACIKLFKRYDKLELVIKSKVPEDIRSLCRNNANIKLIDYELSASQLHELYSSSHIFIRTGHETLGPAILEAMSYGLAVVGNDVYNIPEAIEHEKTGLLIQRPRIDYYTKYGTPKDFKREFMEGIIKSHEFLTLQIYEKIARLIEDNSLRERLGKQARQLIEEGKFSTKERNSKLQTIVEGALSR